MARASETEESVDLDAVLDELGHFGRYQQLLFALMMAPVISNAIYNSQYIFNAADVNYRCVVPECEGAGGGGWAAGEWAAWALVPGERCRRRAPLDAAGCRPDLFANHTVPCDAWLYETRGSIVAEFELACQEWRRTLVGTVHSLGVFAALVCVGAVSDRFGRKFTFATTAWSGAAVGFLRSFVHSYPAYLALEFIESTLESGSYSTCFVLAMEMIGSDRRVACACAISCTFALGQVVLALAARGLPHWRTLTRVIYAPAALYVLYYWLLEESVRWLLVRGRTDEALRVLRKVARVNRRPLRADTEERLRRDKARRAAAAGGEPAGCCQPLRALVRSRVLMFRLGLCSYVWTTITFVYYGLSINSVSLAGDMYVNYILTSLVEIPGYLLNVVTLDRFGRRRTMMASLAFCALVLVSLPALPAAWAGAALGATLAGKAATALAFVGAYVGVVEMFPTTVRARALGFCCLVSRLGQTLAMLTPLLDALVQALTLVAKTLVSLAFAAIYVLCTELFPTSARHTLLNLCSTVGRVGSIAAPLSPMMVESSPMVKYLVFGALAGVAALLLLLAPETAHARLPDDVAQAERLAPPPKLPASPPVAADKPPLPDASPLPGKS